MPPRTRAQQQEEQQPPPAAAAAPAQAQPLPNWETFQQGLTTAKRGLATAGRELSRVPNTFQQSMVEIRNSLAENHNSLHEILRRFDSLERYLQLRDVQAWNATHTNLVALHAQGNPMPDHFPQTAESLYSLSSDHMDPILVYYDLSRDGNITVRRARLARFLGVPAPP